MQHPFSLQILSALVRHNFADWRSASPFILSLALAWVYFFCAPLIYHGWLSEHLPSWAGWMFLDLFWPTAFAGAATMVQSGTRTALPGILALFVALPVSLASLASAGVLVLYAVLGLGTYAWVLRQALRFQRASTIAARAAEA